MSGWMVELPFVVYNSFWYSYPRYGLNSHTVLLLTLLSGCKYPTPFLPVTPVVARATSTHQSSMISADLLTDHMHSHRLIIVILVSTRLVTSAVYPNTLPPTISYVTSSPFSFIRRTPTKYDHCQLCYFHYKFELFFSRSLHCEYALDTLAVNTFHTLFSNKLSTQDQTRIANLRVLRHELL